MNFTREFFAFLTCSAMIMVHRCKADRPPPPTELSKRWLDPFTVNVSWQKPNGVTDGEVHYKYRLKNAPDKSLACTKFRNFTESFLTEETGSDHWTYEIWTVGSQSCESSNESTHVYDTILAPKPRAEVKDMTCFMSYNDMNCSWIPGSQPFNLYYRICGHSKKVIKTLKECDQPYSSGTRIGCYMKFENKTSADICLAVATEAGQSTFKPALVIHPPKMNIREEKDNLILSWTPPEIGLPRCWIYEVCYKQCNMPEECRNVTDEGQPMQVAYNKRCRYEFRSRVKTTRYCKKVSSDFHVAVFYGTNEPPDETLTVVAIIIPIILSACIILSCYCFRRHSSIICPIIPDPSAIFKEMMMNGNKEVKTAEESLYTPMPEPIEPCKITLIAENSVLQQNS